MKPGYKQTEVGVIPEEWNVQTGENITTLIGKGGSPKWQGFEYSNGGMLFVTSENVRDGFLDIKEPKYLPIAFHDKLKRTKLKKDDILVNLVGASIGRSCQIQQDIGEANINQAVAVYRVKEENSSTFLAFCFQAPNTVRRILEMQVDAARPNISLGGLRRFPIQLPSLLEQRAIAQALSDVDALIAALDRLIAKKRDIKQATMQQLLTGKTRLPGFSGTWEQTQMRCLITRLKKTSRLSASGKDVGMYPFFTNTTKPVEKFLDESDFETEAIIANTGGEAYFNYYKGRFAAMSDCLVFESKVDTRFLYYLLKLSEQNINSNGFTGSGIKHLDKKYFEQIEVCHPVQAHEQTAIANVLSDMDSELSALEARRNKTRALKQGMMQELLTGKTRLI